MTAQETWREENLSRALLLVDTTRAELEAFAEVTGYSFVYMDDTEFVSNFEEWKRIE